VIRVALLWQHNANPSYKFRRYDDIVRTAGWAGSARAAGRRPAGDRGRPQNRAPHTGSGRGRPASDRPLTGGVLNITAAVWTAGFHWWHSGNKKRTQNVSEYMFVLAVCLVSVCQSRRQQNRTLAADISYRRFQKGTQFGSSIEGALIYITAQIGELWPRDSSWGTKILKGVKKSVTLFS